MIAALQVLLCLAVPALSLWAAERFKAAKLLGPVVLCYGFGIIVGNLPGLTLERSASMSVSEAAVPLAIPLLLFSTDVVGWLKLARSLLVCFALACVSAVVGAMAVSLLFKGQVAEWWKVAGMLVGVYVGGTANMSAIGVALEASEETFVLLNAADIVAGGAYLLFLLSVGQRVALTFLKPFVPSEGAAHAEAVEETVSPWRRQNALPMLAAFGLSVLIVGLSVGSSFVFFGKISPPYVLLTITTLGIVASFFKPVRGLRGSYDVGEYALLAFCVAIGSMADVRLLAGTSPTLMLFVFLVMVVSIVLHLVLCALFRIDADTALITSTATIFGPAFIGPVAASLKNRQLVGPGLTMGLAGIALGTYLGLFTAWLLK